MAAAASPLAAMAGRLGVRESASAGKSEMSEPGIVPAPRDAKPQPSRWRVWQLRRTPVRTFVIYPAAVIAFELIRRGGTLKVELWGAPLLLCGYLQYRLAGSFRRRHGGGGPGLETPPQRIVSDGPYRFTRNPMYLGHLIFITGLALTFQSWLALGILLVNVGWFHLRVRGDEKNLLAQFGAPYADYCRRVKRWIPRII
jgi:protein-S-isoprenylcysteine O-methyltransferase Ste14